MKRVQSLSILLLLWVSIYAQTRIEHPRIRPIPGALCDAHRSQRIPNSQYVFLISEGLNKYYQPMRGEYWDLIYRFNLSNGKQDRSVSPTDIVRIFHQALERETSEITLLEEGRIGFKIILDSIDELWGDLIAQPGEYRLILIQAPREPIPQTIRQPRFKFNLMERIRLIAYDDLITFDTAKTANTYMKYRTSLGFDWSPVSNFTLHFKITNEIRDYYSPITKLTDWDEIFLDQGYVSLQGGQSRLWKLSVGRQNMSMGNGFLIMEGTPMDASRAIWFDMLRFDWWLASRHQLTFFYSYLPPDDYHTLLLGEIRKTLSEQAYHSLGIFSNMKFLYGDWSVYWLYRQGNKKSSQRLTTYADTNGVILPDTIRTIYLEHGLQTMGTSFTYEAVPRRWSLDGEAALQWGWFDDQGINRKTMAMAGSLNLGFYLPPSWLWKPELSVEGVALTGDKPTTLRNEGWDPLFGRWPHNWSELLIYSLWHETRPAWWSNIYMIRSSLRLNFSRNCELTLSWTPMWTFEKWPIHLNQVVGYKKTTAINPQYKMTELGGNGKFRGTLFILKMEYTLIQSVKGIWQIEAFRPGNYYSVSAEQVNWLMFGLLFRY